MYIYIYIYIYICIINIIIINKLENLIRNIEKTTRI